MTPLTVARLAEAEQVIAKATPGPWNAAGDVVWREVQGSTPVCCNKPHWSGDPRDEPECCGQPDYPPDQEMVAKLGEPADAAFIALSRTLLPDLLALVQALGTLGPEIRRVIHRTASVYEGERTQQESAALDVLRQVQALIPKGDE